MDKLQPLIKHRYWICFGLAVIFVTVGWWMASGAIATETTVRKDIVEKAFTAASQGATEPNEKWVQEAQKENESDNVSYNSASAQLWKRQQNARLWPKEIEKDLKGVPYLDQIKSSETRAKWASIYKDQIEQLLEIVKPFKDGEGLVVVDASNITHKPFNSWRYGPPASPEIWNNQEDIWLLQSILTSIARVNEGATRLTESQVRQINKLTLRGGDRDAKPASGGGGLGGGMGMMGASGGGMALGMGSSGGLGGMGGGEQSASYPGKEFEGSTAGDILAEEFGADAGGGGAAGGSGMSSMGSGGMSSAMMSGGGSMSAAAKKTEEKRFVDEQPGYKTRAFLLDVVVRDDQLPNLLASLTNSDFPVEIVRVDISAASGGVSNQLSGGLSDGPGMEGSEMGGPEMSGRGMSAPGGSGMRMSGPGMSGLGMGSPGLGSPASSSSSLGMGVPGFGGGAAEGMAPGMSEESGGYGALGSGGLGSGKGSETLQAAMIDPLLINVRIGGLMTLYQSAQESNTQAATELAEPVTTPAVVPEPDAPETTESGTEPAATGNEPAKQPGEVAENAETPAAAPAETVPAPTSGTEPPVPDSDGAVTTPATVGNPEAQEEPASKSKGSDPATPENIRKP